MSRRTIYKYELGITTEVRLAKPKVMFVAAQHETVPTAWISHDPDAEPDTLLKLQLVGTGHDVPGGEHVGSFLHGPYVWHVFEERETL